MPKEIAKASFKTSGSFTFTCNGSFTPYCYEAVIQVTNTGPGCARAFQPIVKFYGADGAAGAGQLGADLVMYLPGASLTDYVWRPGVTLAMTSVDNFADVRSAHTRWDFVETHTDVECPAAVPAPPSPPTFQTLGSPLLSCVTGFCATLTQQVVFNGPGCVTAANFVYRAYGNNGAPGSAQLGYDIPLRGSQSLATYIWKPGASMLVTSMGGFVDVRSANTVFQFSETHADVACPL